MSDNAGRIADKCLIVRFLSEQFHKWHRCLDIPTTNLGPIVHGRASEIKNVGKCWVKYGKCWETGIFQKTNFFDDMFVKYIRSYRDNIISGCMVSLLYPETARGQTSLQYPRRVKRQPSSFGKEEAVNFVPSNA